MSPCSRLRLIVYATFQIWISPVFASGSKVTNKSGTPPAINLDTIRLNGDADSFTVSWSPVRAEDGKKAFYNVEIEYQNEPPRNKRLDYPNITINYIEPYTNFTLTITPCTEWGCNYTRPNQKQLQSPESVPTVPLRPRKYVTYHRHYLSNSMEIEVEFRWSRPRKVNGRIMQYRVFQASDPSGPWIPQPRIYPKRRYHTINKAKPNTTYYFKVCACTTVGCGPLTDVVQVNTADEKPVPVLLALDSQMLGIFYVDDNSFEKNLARGHIISLTYIAQEDTFYWINDSKNIVRMNGLNNTGEEQIVETENAAKGLTADWIGHNLYWLEDKPAEENRIMKYSLSQDNKEPEPVLKRRATLWKVAVDPYRSSLFWTESRNGSNFLMKCRLDGSQIRTVLWHHNSTTSSIEYRYKNEDRIQSLRRYSTRQKSRSHSRPRRELCNCPGLAIGPTFIMDHTKVEEPEIYVVDNLTGSIWATDSAGCHCRLVVDAQQGDKYGLPPDSLTVDLDRLYWTNKQKASVNSVLKESGADFITEHVKDTPNIIAYGKHLQPMPDPECLLVGNYTEPPQSISTTNTSLTLSLLPWQYDTSCSNISLPPVKYTLLYRVMKRENDIHDCRVPGICAKKGSYEPILTLSDLRPDTLYQVQAMVSNVYTREANYPGRHGIFRTKKGIPSPPRNVHTRVRSPYSLDVWWQIPQFLNGPKEDVNYVVEWSFTYKNGTGSGGSNNINNLQISYKDGINYYTTELHNLQPNMTYHIKVLAYDRARTGYSASNVVSNTTFLLPANLVAKPLNATTIQLTWVPPEDSSVVRHTFSKSETQNPEDFTTVSLVDFTNQTHPAHTKLVSKLEANKLYYFTVTLVYRYGDILQLPPVNCTTPVGPPSKPDPPSTISRPSEMLVKWNRPYDGGSPIEGYILEYRHDDSSNWTLVYNNTATQWVVTNLPIKSKYMFRVAAINALGMGEFSDSEVLSFQPYTGLQNMDRLTVILASSFGVLIVLICVAVIALVIGCRRYKESKQIPFSIVPGNRNSPDLELATLRELPRVTVQTSNALYAINSDHGQLYSRWRCSSMRINGIIPTDEDIAALPHFRRDQLTLTKFLGSGAFGEVFEGVARNILSPVSGETRVAVKTLRKGATDQEKEEFLKEALLMSNFKYDYILRLLGVCLDNDPQFIILELMEGGDLLSYLRSSRPTPTSPAKLNLPDMVGICVDVSRGCRHLEDMHFVHRDLAARNCLVSSRNPQHRVVKIGDFGLARDIYKNDYYRKEGEGLLPVRWMSPESLIDGVFTTQSDVWAFGVLMWEVLTLGQQPYPARTNLEVLHFVRSGGRLDRPDNCPDDLYHLMLKCWCYNPDERPSFTYLLSQLEGFKERSMDPLSEFTGKNGLNGTVKLPPLEKKDLKDWSEHSGSSLGSHKGEQQEGTMSDRSPSATSLSNSITYSSSFGNRDPDHGYLEPVSSSSQNHKYLELIDSAELGNGSEISSPSPNKPSSSSDSLEGATASSSSSQPSGEQPEGDAWVKANDNKNGYSRTPSLAKNDVKTGKTLHYAQLAQSAQECKQSSDEAASPRKVKPPYRGPHSYKWDAGSGTGIPVLRDIAGRSVPQPLPKHND